MWGHLTREIWSTLTSDHGEPLTARLEAGTRCRSTARVDVETAWAACADLFCQAVNLDSEPPREQFERELAFCLLGGFGISYEHALSVTEHIIELDPFDRAWDEDALEKRLMFELSQPRYQPRRADGSLRRYRFPKRKAQVLVTARRWLLDQGDVVAALTSIDSDRDRRQLMHECPGIGLKTASWLLRNLGLGTEFAILDVHVTRAMQAAGRIGPVRLPQDYELVEQAFLRWCCELNAPASAFDLFLWEWQRGSLLVSR